jgi:UDP-2,3-diacylglucosamine pyrophosphatase LpxH
VGVLGEGMGKFKIVLSDLHLGAGYAKEGNALEDFSSDEAFRAFLSRIAGESEREGKPVELIFAGDTFEFPQVPRLDSVEEFSPSITYPVALYLASSEGACVRKVALIMAGHPDFFAALRDFLRPTRPRRTVTFIKGNHDVDLHWRGVQEMLAWATGAEGKRADCLSFVERRISREGLYVEHGNQYADRFSRFPDFEEPHDPDAPGQLYLPTGSRFIINFFNEVERERYWMDGVKPISALVWYTFALDSPFALRMLMVLLQAMPAMIWDGRQGAGKTAGPEAIRELLEGLQDDAYLESLQRDAWERQRLYNRVDDLLGSQAGYSAAKRTSLASLPPRLMLRQGRAEERAQRSKLYEVAAQKSLQERARIVIFGHTHAPSIEPLSNGGLYINTGTWTWAQGFAGKGYAAWKRLMGHPERYTGQRRLTYARIDYDEAGKPSAKLRTFDHKGGRQDLWQRLWGRWQGRR